MAAAAPIVFAYDGSDHSRLAIERGAELLEPRPAIALTVWESVGSIVFRHDLPEPFLVARDVVEDLDTSTRAAAERTAAEGAELIRALGFDAQPLPRRAYEESRREATTVWQEVVRVAEEHAAAAVVLGRRGQSGVRSAVLGSVSHGVANHCSRPVLVVPAEESVSAAG